MKKMIVAAALALLPLPAFATPVLVVSPHSAPNAFGSPNYGAYRDNVLAFLINGTASPVSRAVDPAGFEMIPNLATVTPGEAIVTNFSSWRGVAGAGGAFAGEFGNRMHFGLSVTQSDPNGLYDFTLANVQFDMNSSDGGNIFDFDGDLAGLDFGNNRVGIHLGQDGIRSADDTYFCAAANCFGLLGSYGGTGSDATLIHELFYIGVGNAIEALSGDPDLLVQQAAINAGAAFYVPALTLSTTYTVLGDFQETGAVTVDAPEPASLALLGAGLAGLGWSRRRRAA